MILGYVYADDNPDGLYYVDWCEGPHDVRAAFITVSLGNYADETATGGDRSAFCIETRCEGMSLTEQPVRDRPEFLGQFMPREEALVGRTSVMSGTYATTSSTTADSPLSRDGSAVISTPRLTWTTTHLLRNDYRFRLRLSHKSTAGTGPFHGD